MSFPRSAPGDHPASASDSDTNRVVREREQTITIRELHRRLSRGLIQIIAFSLLGLVIAAAATALTSQFLKTETQTRVIFSFPGFERGEYPDRSKFQADDLRAPMVVAEAMRRLGLDTSEDAQSKIRSSISVEGVIPDSIVRNRDRLRAAGQTPPTYLPDEYTLTLTLERRFPLSNSQRAQLLVEIVNVARENFKRTYGQLPVAFGTAYEVLKGADLPEYEIVFNSEIRNLTAYLATQADEARSFRSPTTNMSFKDLAEQVNLFAQLQLNATLGIIHEKGLARNRQNAILKMDYYLLQLKYQESHALEEEKVVRELLEQVRTRDQNYVLGVKSQAVTRPGETPLLDKGLIDSITANDAYNFLVRRALDAGLRVKQVQSQIFQLNDLRSNLQAFADRPATSQTVDMEQLKESLAALEVNYNRLVANIRKTHADFADQEYGHAISLSAKVRTHSLYSTLAIAAGVGLVLGTLFGAGLSLLEYYPGERRTSA